MRSTLRSLVIVSLLSASCGPAPQPTDISRVGALDLVNHIRDHGDKAYRGRRVQVRLPPKSYTAEGDCILYYTGLPNSRPVIVFTCHDPLPAHSPESTLIVSGTCQGAVTDGIRKADRVTFFITVEGCTVTRLD